MTVEAASLPADGQLGQDRHFIGDDFAIVLDGASSPVPSDRDGGWYADVLGTNLAHRLRDSGSVDLRNVLADSIADVAERYDLVPGQSPSSTVAIAHWDTTQLHALVLGDSPIVVINPAGVIRHLRDDRLGRIAISERQVYRDALRRGSGYGHLHRDHLRRLVDAERRSRNRPGGYWIAEANPDAANHAVCDLWLLTHLRYVLLVTDGVSRGVEQYHVPHNWTDTFDLVQTQGPSQLLKAIHAVEEADNIGQQFPRSKLHDDKTIVTIGLAPRAHIQSRYES